MNMENITQQIGDLMMNLVEILPVNWIRENFLRWTFLSLVNRDTNGILKTMIVYWRNWNMFWNIIDDSIRYSKNSNRRNSAIYPWFPFSSNHYNDFYIMNICSKVRRKRLWECFSIDLIVLELLIYYKQNNNEMEYQDCYGVYIKIQDHIENFTESLSLLVIEYFQTSISNLCFV